MTSFTQAPSPKPQAHPGTPVTLRVNLERHGDFVIARCCAVSSGNPHFFSIAVDVKKVTAALIAHAKAKGLGPSDSVSGFGHWLKGAVKSITHAKIVKGIAGVIGKVVNNPLIGGALSMIPGVGLLSAAAHVSTQAIAGLGMASKALDTVHKGAQVSKLAKDGAKLITQGKAAAALITRGKGTPALANKVRSANNLRAVVAQHGPLLAKKSNDARRVQASFANIAKEAKCGGPTGCGNADAKLTAGIIARTAKMHDQLARIGQTGQAGLLVSADGKIQKSAKGRWLQTASAVPAAQKQMLYLGPGKAPIYGRFAAVSGAGRYGLGLGGGNAHGDGSENAVGSDFGGARTGPVSWVMGEGTSDILVGSAWGTPAANDPEGVDGPLYPVKYPDTLVEGSPKAWRKPTQIELRKIAAARLALARTRHSLETAERRLSKLHLPKVGTDMSHNDLPEEMAEQYVGCSLDSVHGVRFPSGLFTRPRLSAKAVKARFARALAKMPPKLRRRVVTRLRAAMHRARVSGAVINMQPNVGWHAWPQGQVSGVRVAHSPWTP